MSVLQGIGIVIQIFLALAGFLLILYFAVIIKLVGDAFKTKYWKIIFGLITPVFFVLGLIASNVTGKGEINFIIVFLLTILNLSYMLSSINYSLIDLIYNRRNEFAYKILYVIVSILISFTLVMGTLMLIVYMVNRLQ